MTVGRVRRSGPMILGLAVCFLLLTGVVGIGRAGGDVLETGLRDFEITREAGRALREGLNAYIPSTFEPYLLRHATGIDATSPYSYPPHVTTLLAGMSVLPQATSKVVWVLVLLLTFVPSMLIVGGMSRENADVDSASNPPARPLAPWVFAALVCANPVASHDLWLGQPALLSALGLLVVFVSERARHSVASGVGLALAAMKPQLSVLVIFYLLLERRWRSLAVAAVIVTALSLYPLLAFGPEALVRSYAERLRTHATWQGNLPGSEPSIGLRSVFWAAGVHVPGLELVGLGLTAVVWRFRRRLRPDDIFALLFGLTLLFVFNQDSAYVLIVPLASALWVHARGRRSLTWAMAALGVLFVLPRRLIRLAELPVLNQWRTFVTVALVALLLFALRAVSKGLHAPARVDQLDT